MLDKPHNREQYQPEERKTYVQERNSRGEWKSQSDGNQLAYQPLAQKMDPPKSQNNPCLTFRMITWIIAQALNTSLLWDHNRVLYKLTKTNLVSDRVLWQGVLGGRRPEGWTAPRALSYLLEDSVQLETRMYTVMSAQAKAGEMRNSLELSPV